MPPVKHIRDLLVFIDTLTGWIETFPTTNKRATTVATILFREIIPCFGLPTSLQSDNGPEFTSSMVGQNGMSISHIILNPLGK
jgi:transposase InsO family protein